MGEGACAMMCLPYCHPPWRPLLQGPLKAEADPIANCPGLYPRGYLRFPWTGLSRRGYWWYWWWSLWSEKEHSIHYKGVLRAGIRSQMLKQFSTISVRMFDCTVGPRYLQGKCSQSHAPCKSWNSQINESQGWSSMTFRHDRRCSWRHNPNLELGQHS